MISHRPSGEMCKSCVFFSDEFKLFCSNLNFAEMPQLAHKGNGRVDSDGTVIVKCREFKREITSVCTEHGGEL